MPLMTRSLIDFALKLEHDENDHGLIEKIISLCDPNCDVGMLWQFKSHHSHLKIGMAYVRLGYILGKKRVFNVSVGHLGSPIVNVQVAGDRFRNMNVWAANLMQHKCKVKADDLGSLYFLQAQALCLRALSIYENCNSKKIIWCKQNFTEDIEKALKLVTNTYFSELAF
ncbi:hypothetical protein Tco_0604695 [Tanacetum coccineum]